MVCVGAVAVYTRGLVQKLLILVGIALSYVIYFVLANVLHMGPAIDFSIIANAAWFGLPHFSTPTFDFNAVLLITPVVIILIGENLGHVKAVTAMTGRNLDPYMGRAFLGDGIATMFAASFGGTGVKWIDKLMPPVVTGAVVAVIGLNLAPTACKSVGTGTFNNSSTLTGRGFHCGLWSHRHRRSQNLGGQSG